MTETPLQYASNVERRRSKLAICAITFTAVAAALMTFAFLEGSSNSDSFGLISLPIAVVGTILTVVAVFRKMSRGVLTVVSSGIAIAYWAAVAAMIVPKLLAGGF